MRKLLLTVTFVLLMANAGLLWISTAKAARKSDQEAAKLKDQLLGTWMLFALQSDNRVDMLGAHPTGMIVFDASGHFTSQVMRSDLPKFASSDRTKATPDESVAVIRGFMGLFGTYNISDPSTISLHIIASSFPNWDGAEQTRAFVIKGDELELINRTNSFGQTSVHAFWKHVSGTH